MCPQCQHMAERTKFQEVEEHLELMFQLGGLVQAGTLLMRDGPTCPGSNDSETAAIDIAVHVFECTRCQRRFRLTTSSHEGVGAMWQVDVKKGYSQLH